MTSIDTLSSSLDRHYVLATDGGSSPNPGPSGWAYVKQLKHGTEVVQEANRSGRAAHSTNNRMELTAAILALRSLKERNLPVIFVTDSRYVSDNFQKHLPTWIKRGWRKSDGKGVLNAELWQDLAEAADGLTIHWLWLPAHAGHDLNEQADALVARARGGNAA